MTQPLNQQLLETPIQHIYSDEHNHCHGCGKNNDAGLQLKSYWNGKEATAELIPEAKYNGIPNFVYGGLVASLIDCHAMAAAAADCVEHDPSIINLPRFVTGTLSVKYVKPTPLSDQPLEMRAWVSERKGKKVTVLVELGCNGVVTAEGNVVAFQIPQSMES